MSILGEQARAMTCPVCGSPFEDNSHNHAKRYCCERCRQFAYDIHRRYGPDEPLEPHMRKRKPICNRDCFHCEYPDCIK